MPNVVGGSEMGYVVGAHDARHPVLENNLGERGVFDVSDLTLADDLPDVIEHGTDSSAMRGDE